MQRVRGALVAAAVVVIAEASVVVCVGPSDVDDGVGGGNGHSLEFLQSLKEFSPSMPYSSFLLFSIRTRNPWN